MTFLNSLLPFITVLALFSTFLLCVQSFNLTLIHNNDLHSHFAPVNQWSSPCDDKSLKEGKCFGGVARIIAKVKEIREKNKNNSLFLNAGDSFQGTVWYSLYKWQIVSHFTRLLDYDAMTVGNHEFDDGVDGYYPFVDETKAFIPTICCNIDVSEEPKLNGKIKKSIIIEVDDHKIGIVGYITPETDFLSNPGHKIKFLDEIQSVKEEVKKLEDQGIKIIIGLSHSGYVKDLEVAKSVPQIDVIVGGHSHSLLYSGPQPSVEEVVDTYPAVVKHGSQQTLVLQAYAFGKYLGLIDIEFDSNGNVCSYKGQPILLDHTVPEDPEVAEEVAMYDKKVKAKYGEVLGKTNVFLEGGTECRLRECNLGNLITEATVEYYMRNRGQKDGGWTDAAVAVLNGGGVRATINALNKGGNITLEDVLTVMPFGNTLITLAMPGKLIREMLEFSVEDYNPKEPHGKFLQMSGLRVVYNLTQPEEHRVRSVLIRCANCLVPEYKPLNDSETYKVIVPKYIADGGDGYSMLNSINITRIQSEALDYQIISDYLRSRPSVYQGIDHRITFVK